jgi:diguanylate cyclase (GGDEF)-like protein/PAS domain S-box-containing protein
MDTCSVNSPLLSADYWVAMAGTGKDQVAPAGPGSERLRAAFEQGPIAIAQIGLDGHLLEVNREWERLTGSNGEPGSPLAEAFDVEDEIGIDQLIAAARDGAEPVQRNVLVRRRDAPPVPCQLDLALVGAGREAPPFLVAHLHDISEHRRLEREMRRLAETDPLTGLPNRRRFEREVEERVRDPESSDGRGTLLLLDLDDFKDVNDQFGHGAGDDVLTAVGEALWASVRGEDLIGRIGGDEFAVLLAPSRAARGDGVAARLLAELHASGRKAGGLPVTASVGVYSIPSAPISASELWRRVDRAMYGAKARGGGRFVVWTDDLLAPSLERRGTDPSGPSLPGVAQRLVAEEPR